MKIDYVEGVRNAIAGMRKYKYDHNQIGDVRVGVSEDVMEVLKGSKVMTMNVCGKYFLDNVPVIELKGYPTGYIAAE